MIQRHYLNGVEVTPPINYAELSLELVFDNAGNSQNVSINDWDWTADGLAIIMNAFELGQIFEGIPHRIEIDGETGTTYTVFDGFVDFSKKAIFKHDKITATSTPFNQLDWLADISDSKSYAYLESIGIIKSSDYKLIPYCINKKQNTFENIISLVTVYFVYDKIKEQIQDLTEKTASATNPFEATVIIRLALRILYITVMITALINLIITLYKQLVQPVKYHSGMYVLDLIEKGLSSFGLKLSSSILQQGEFRDLFILPEKYTQIEKDGISGLLDFKKSTETGYYNGTVGQLLDALKLMFNARIIIIDGTLYFEKFDYEYASPRYTLPDLWDARYEFELNTDEFISTYLLEFARDSSDRNTIQEYKGTSVQVTTKQNSISDKRLSLAKGFERKSIPFALGKIKQELSFVEKTIDTFIKGVGVVINALISVINNIIDVINQLIRILNKILKALKVVGINISFEIRTISRVRIDGFTNIIENRKGMLMMESDYVNVPKLMIVPRNTNKPKQTSLLTARYLYENFHYFNTFAPTNNYIGNQYLLRSANGIPFTFQDYENVRLNNKLLDYASNSCIFTSIKLNINGQTADTNYREHKQYTNNLSISIYEPE